MRVILLLPIMLFLHVFADYTLQGILASMKQKIWWENEDKRYKNDYKIALATHAFEWSFAVTLPIAINLWNNGSILLVIVYLLTLILGTK